MSRTARKLFRKLTLSKTAIQIYDHFLPAQTLGQRGEREAERFLLRQGMVIIHRGFQDKFGEIDLIVVDGETVVFVEVKTRTSDAKGTPAEAVDEEKQTHLTKTAIGFLKWNRLTECRARFDVISIMWPTQSEEPKIVHIENAFEPVGDFQMF
ncbi:MAG: YraN family protein [Mariniblastus sp.]